MREEALIIKLAGTAAVVGAAVTTDPVVWHYLVTMSVAVALAVAGSAFDAYGSDLSAQERLKRVGMAGVTAFIVFSMLRLRFPDSIQAAAVSAAVAITGRDVIRSIAESVFTKYLAPEKDESNGPSNPNDERT